jgi:hypothetical protein
MLDQSEPAKKIRFFSWRQRTPRITTENAEKQKKRNLAKLAQFDNAIVIEIMSVVLTIYLVKSFEYRTMKTMVLKEVDLSMKASELMAQISSNILHCLPPHSFSFLHPPISFWAIALTLALTYPKSICVPAIPKRHPGYLRLPSPAKLCGRSESHLAPLFASDTLRIMTKAQAAKVCSS